MSGANLSCDKTPSPCRASDKGPTLPAAARLPINRCNLPAVILGGLTYQQHPVPLVLDGVETLHRALFQHLDAVADIAARGQLFRDYMAAHFCLDQLEEAGYEPASGSRGKANWLRLLRGWSFDADGLEGAALKAWVESRFGLPPRFHGQPLRDYGGAAWRRYEEMRSRALYGTNALEAQLDVLYAWCQYEFHRAGSARGCLDLYRGVNRLDDHEVLSPPGDASPVVLFNNLTSFSTSKERAGEFGDAILEVRVPAAKVLFHHGLLPSLLKGEDEYLVIGGVYRVRRWDF
ncbi:MAG: NAD(+)--dinitrogen-reductase ADP-D-ribosyltransferase [Rhodocyclaceae bacterium]|nr:MAG: NAD(+)--dinitrogen-reductase ADP-D-ribosyltransferase [Rhodocyclaceae bacterium]